MDITFETNPESWMSCNQVAWLLADGKRVAWADYHLDENGTPMLHTIETRPGYRQQGFATLLLNAIAEHCGVEAVHHDAGFTPEGLSYISGKLTRPEWAGESVARFRSMDFICDWEQGYKHDSRCEHND